MILGGMPAVVARFMEHKNYSGILDIQKQFSKVATGWHLRLLHLSALFFALCANMHIFIMGNMHMCIKILIKICEMAIIPNNKRIM
ncbi:MAG: hypothetical protein MJ134_03205 [Lachnospiraceae bacterium]|nr:hypothetical protein [Lachnospiraceae bacterium]